MADTCILHCCEGNISDKLEIFSEVRWSTTIKSCRQWCSLDEEEQTIAERLLLIDSKPETPCFHSGCYQRFNSKRRIEQAQRRFGKGTAAGDVSSTVRTQRQNSGETTRSESILPPICVVCRKTKWKNYQGKWAPEKLVQVG